MTKIFKRKFVLLNLAVIITAAVFAFNPLSASAENIADFIFQSTPLFGDADANIMPGDSVTKWVKVTNLINDNLIITTNAATSSNTDGLGDRMNLTIKKGSDIYFNNTMTAFFAAGVVNLGSLAAYQTGQYDYTVSFDSASDNNFQNKTLSFDISVSAQASESIGGETPTPPGDSSGGGYIINELNLTNINAILTSSTTDASITVTWLTNKLATSRIIYDTVPHPDLSLALPPNYGYAYSTIQDPTKVTGHSVTIPGLILGQTYYLRPLSAASPEKYGTEVAVMPGADGTVTVQTEQIPPPTPKQAVLGEKITATSDGNNLAETGFSLFELFILVAIIITLLALRILLKRYDKTS